MLNNDYAKSSADKNITSTQLYKEIPQTIKAVYDRLADDESRFIFDNRFLYFLSSDSKHVWKLSDKVFNRYYSDEMAELIRLKRSGFDIALYGAGLWGGHAATFFERHGLIVDFFCDNNPGKQKNGYMDLPVISPQELFRKKNNIAVVITTSSIYVKGIKRELNKHGANLHIYDFLLNCNTMKYFDYDFLKPVENEVYIDCGVLDGGTIKEFSDFTSGQYKKMYGYEPDTISFNRTLEYLREHNFERVEMINKGAWSKTSLLSFSAQGDGGSHISDGGSANISVTTIDETIGDDLITMIKMDIEGAELEALKGAENTIRRNKPRLAICVYHKPEDILEIPLYLYSLVPEYKFFIRHESFSSADTILYAILEE